MKILNVMLSRELGGIQQSFMDYSKALKMEGCDNIDVISMGAKIAPNLEDQNFKIFNFCSFDPISKLQIQHLINTQNPDVIIAHGNRAIKFCLNRKVPIVGIAHNYNTKYLLKCDYVLATTNHLKKYIIQQGLDAQKIFVMPNMISLPKIPITQNIPQQILTIGTMARFVKKKGLDIFLIALSLLKSKGLKFKAIIGGEGEEERHLKQLCTKLGLDSCVKFTGWIKDKEEFFGQIDIFCLPATHEPFGIILLEAMARNKPVVSLRSEGPTEIIEDGRTGFLCDMTAVSLSNKLETVMHNPDLNTQVVKNAYLRIIEKYDIKVASKTLYKFLEKIIHDVQSHKA